MNGTAPTDDLWARTLHAQALERMPCNFGSAALLVLQELLLRAKQDIAMATLRAWPREQKGAAYLWAVAFIEGREDSPPPFGERGRPAG